MAGRSILYVVGLPLVQLAVACSPAQTDESAPPTEASSTQTGETASAAEAIGDGPLVVAFGDSLFAGYSLEQGEGLVPELQRALAAGGIDAYVANAAVSGDTTSAGRQRLDFALDGLPRKPDLVIVGLGGNDMLRGLDPTETEANLDAILARLKERGIPAMLSGMVAPPNMGADYAAAFNPIYPRLAAKYDVPLYPFTLDGVYDRPDLLLADGIHPNPQGVEVIVSKLAPVVAHQLK